MAEGRVLHLRCFLEGIEVPITSCAVTAQVGSPASAHVELLDSEYIFKLLPRTMIHVFFYDHMNGSNYNPPVYDLGSMKNASSYKLLFCGEIFSVYHNKSGFGSRTVTVMALDISNILDTNYIHQVSYVNTEGILGVGDQAAAQFTAGQSIGNNPFDDIINSPSMVIQHLASERALSPTHAKRISKIGGLFAIFEMLLGVDRHAMGMNSWLTVHERRVRFLDMVDADSGETAARLFGDAVFEEWIQGSLGTQTPSMSFRQISHLLLSYIYYRMCPIPTASYHKPAGLSDTGGALTGREKPEIVVDTSTESTLDDSLSGYFASNAWNTAASIHPDLRTLAINVVENLREGKNSRTKHNAIITSGFRTPANNARSTSNSLHLRGLAVDIDANVWPEALPGMSGYTYGSMFISTAAGSARSSNQGSNNVSFTTTQTLASLPVSDEDIETLISLGYLNNGSTASSPKATDGRILRFFLNMPAGVNGAYNNPNATDMQTLWIAVAPAFEEALFDGVIYNVQQFICWLMVYPCLPNASHYRVDHSFWLPKVEAGYDSYISYWKSLLDDPNRFATEVLDSTNPSALLSSIDINGIVAVFLGKWFSGFKPFFKDHIFSTGTPIVESYVPIMFKFEQHKHKFDSSSQTEFPYVKRVIPASESNAKIGQFRGKNDGTGLRGDEPLRIGLPDNSHYNAFFAINDFAGFTRPFESEAKLLASADSVGRIPYNNLFSYMGFLNLNTAKKLSNLICTYYDKKKSYWNDLLAAVREEAFLLGLQDQIYTGIDRRIVNHRIGNITHWVGSPIYPILGITGDDPVHIALPFDGDFESGEQADGLAQSQEDAEALYQNRERMVGFLATPDIWMCAPPKCNVIFPEEVMSLNVSREMMRQTSRVMLMTYDSLLADNVILNAHYFAPQFQDTDSIKQIAFGTSTANEVVYPHEKFSGIIPKVQRRSELSFYSRASNAPRSDTEVTRSTADELENQSYETQYAELSRMATAGIADKIRAYGSNVAHFELLKQRYSSTRISVTCKFLPRLVPSLPGLVIGKQVRGRDFRDTHTWLGMLESVQHTYSQAGATTSVTFSTCRPYDTGEGSIDELAALKLTNSNLFLNQDPDTLFEASTANATVSGSPMLSYHLPVPLPKALYGDAVSGISMSSLAAKVLSVFTEGNELDNNTIFVAPRIQTRSVDSRKSSIEKLILSAISYFETYPLSTAQDASPDFFDQSSSDIRTESVVVPQVQPGGSVKYGHSTKFETDTQYKNRTYVFKASGSVSDSANTYDLIVNYLFSSDTETVPYGVNASLNIDVRGAIEGVYYYLGYDPATLGTIAESTTTLATQKADEVTQKISDLVVDSPDFLVESGGRVNSIQEVTHRPIQAPILGYLKMNGYWKSGVSEATRKHELANNSTMTLQATGVSFSSPGIFDKFEIVMSSLYDPITKQNAYTLEIPVLMHVAEFPVQLSETVADSNAPVKLIPLEEAIMPPWIDDQYKNGLVDPSSKTVNGTGIGELYKTWFGCGSILDDITYSDDSIYYTVTIEESVKKLLSTYASSDLEPVYSWTHRNIATLKDILTPANETERSSKDVFQSGGFHAAAVGDYENLEGLGLIGQQLRSNVIVTTTITIPDTAAELDPRLERRKRVKVYRDYIVSTRGKIG